MVSSAKQPVASVTLAVYFPWLTTIAGVLSFLPGQENTNGALPVKIETEIGIVAPHGRMVSLKFEMVGLSFTRNVNTFVVDPMAGHRSSEAVIVKVLVPVSSRVGFQFSLPFVSA